jgi:hypothetical protein
MIAATDNFLSEKAAARVLQVHPGTLRRYRTQGRIAFYRTATGRIHYRFDDLMKFALPVRFDPVAGALAPPAPVNFAG